VRWTPVNNRLPAAARPPLQNELLSGAGRRPQHLMDDALFSGQLFSPVKSQASLAAAQEATPAPQQASRALLKLSCRLDSLRLGGSAAACSTPPGLRT